MTDVSKLLDLPKKDTATQVSDHHTHLLNDAYDYVVNNKVTVGLGTAAVVLGAVAATRFGGTKTIAENVFKGSENGAQRAAHLESRGMGIAGGIKSAEAEIGKPREFLHPESVKLQQEMTIKDDVRKLYEKAFPIEERQPTEEVAQLIAENKILLHTTRDAQDNLIGYSFVSVHDKASTLSHFANENPPQFAHLDFLAVEDAMRSHGAGTLHMRRLIDELKTTRPDFKALTLEMEDPLAAGLSADVKADRMFRSKFYERLGAKNELPGKDVLDPATGTTQYQPGFKILDFDQIADKHTWTAAADNQPAEFRVFWLTDKGRPSALDLAKTFYRSESGYAIDVDHPAMTELLRLHGK